MPMRRRLWLALAVVLFALAAWLMSSGEETREKPDAKNVAFPRWQRPDERKRMVERRTLPAPPPPPAVDPEQPPPPAPVRDPVMAALPAPDPSRSTVVFEANALRHSPLGELFLNCLLADSDLAELDRLRDEFGVDLLEDVDRVALSGDTVVVSGHFGGAKWDRLERSTTPRRMGEHATVYEPANAEHGEWIATWKGELFLLAKSREELQAAVDRLEGRAPIPPPVIKEGMAFGEVYGVLSPQQLATLLPADQRELAQRLEGAADRIELHVDTSGDVAIVAGVSGPQEDQVVDLGKSLGAALAIGRLKAQADGDEELQDLLELARVVPQGGEFSLELALPLPVLQKHIGPCRRGADGGAGTAEAPVAPAAGGP